MNINVVISEDEVYIGRIYEGFQSLCTRYEVELSKESIGAKIVRAELKFEGWTVFESIKHLAVAYLYYPAAPKPPWFDERAALKRVKSKYKEWYKEHVLIGQEISEISSGFYSLKKCKIECLSGDVIIDDCEDTEINVMLDRARIKRCKNIQVSEMFDESKITQGNEGIVMNVYDDASVDSQKRIIEIAYDHRKKEES